jgi:uncharacterized protein (DUF433 family)/DNA-binding transcriptional MerR regulator
MKRRRQKQSTGDTLLGAGAYSFNQAARLTGVHPNTIANWAGERKGFPSVIKRQASDRGRILTFAELMELQFVNIFRKEGVSLQTIRKASATASKKFHADYPFSVKRFDTDGKTVFATLISKESDSTIVEDLKHGQLVFEQIIKPFFHKLDFHGAESVERYWPMDKSGRVVLDPMRHFGQPIDAETGVPTSAIADAVNAGGGQDVKIVADWFNLPLEAVLAAVNFERSLCA